MNSLRIKDQENRYATFFRKESRPKKPFCWLRKSPIICISLTEGPELVVPNFLLYSKNCFRDSSDSRAFRAFVKGLFFNGDFRTPGKKPHYIIFSFRAFRGQWSAVCGQLTRSYIHAIRSLLQSRMKFSKILSPHFCDFSG
jgi:hypothetical protein